jgi:peptidoglycan hydrolase CwlO-like protein
METVKELLMSAARYTESASQRLDRVSTQQETNALAIERLVERQSRTDTAIERLADNQSRTDTVIERLAENQSRTDAAIEALTVFAGEVFKSIQEMQSEVRELHTENCRILDRLERHMGDGHGAEQ